MILRLSSSSLLLAWIRSALLLVVVIHSTDAKRQSHNPHMKGNRYDLTLFIRNHNVTDATFFRLVGVDNTMDFRLGPGDVMEHTFEVRRRGYWTLFVEFPGDRYSKSPRKVYYFPHAVGFTEWHKLSRRKERQLRRKGLVHQG
ncbi:hypothetical protein PRIPAC_71846 [Pristionchus pacificus]|uniref:Uncharacterized protein n=1 Tax=Pristionchus pacificus TaxID=54126 RepID=A0A2A6C1E2_PRIPA|nr:hypothetical protein PRIPAC_71846 [Pristionchus pacificus]|eukprot:PDM71843.1 hypothetical protein PRIPAC_38250 [Pristionchus pacificus]